MMKRNGGEKSADGTEKNGGAQSSLAEMAKDRDDPTMSRRATERAETRLRETLEQIPAAFLTFDRDWKLVYVNQRASDLWRVSLMDRIGELLWDITPGWDETDFGKRVLAAVSGVERNNFDHWHRRLERWLDVRVYSGADGVSIFVDDVTERRRRELHQTFLSEASEVLSGSLDLNTTRQNVADIAVKHIAEFCLVDSIGEPGRIAHTAIRHHDPVQHQRLATFRERFPFDHDAKVGPGLALRTGQSHLYETIDEETQSRIRERDDRLNEFLSLGFRSVIVSPMMSRGIVQGVISLVSTTPGHFTPLDMPLADELARRAGVAIDNARLYRDAQTAVSAREQFLLTVAHELRTPITSIQGFAGMLQREASGANNRERIQRYVRRLTDASSRLSALVEDVLDVSHLRSKQFALRSRAFDLAVLTREAIDRIAEQRPEAKAHLAYEGPESGGTLFGDDGRIEQVLSNLIDNAIKYSPQGSEITVRLATTQNGYELSVIDHGIGLPPGTEEMIFEPFGRAKNALDAHVPGLGIGLSIARRIIERHDGEIWAESEGEGHGVSIRFRLPAKRLD